MCETVVMRQLNTPLILLRINNLTLRKGSDKIGQREETWMQNLSFKLFREGWKEIKEHANVSKVCKYYYKIKIE